MKINTGWILLTLAAAALAMACGNFDDGGEGADDDIICLDCDDPWWIDDDNHPPAEQGEEPEGGEQSQNDEEPGEIAQPLAPCQPQAVATDGADIPEIPDDVFLDECPLEYEVDISESPQEVVSWEWNGNILERSEYEGSQLVAHAEFEFDSILQRLQSVETYQRNRYSGATYENNKRWEFDEREQLVEYHRERLEYSFGTVEVVNSDQIHQTWDGDRLVERVQESMRHGNETSVHFVWKYDDLDRLTEVIKERDDEPLARSLWSYSKGNPVGVERLIGDVAVERQSFEFDGDRLVARDIAVDPRGIDGELDSFGYASRVSGHDSYAVDTSDMFHFGNGDLDNPWVNANAHLQVAAGDECYRLPTSLGHGYPDDEASYHLAWTDGEQNPQGIGFAYHFGGYAYFYGDNSWFGHLGIGSSWPSIYPNEIDSQYRLTYDESGRMIGEEFDFTDLDGDSVAVQRARSFDESGLNRDRLSVARDGDEAHAELHFERDENGRLQRRERLRGDQVVSVQKWDFDEAGHATGLHLLPEVHDTGYWPVTGPNPSPAELFEAPVGEPTASRSYERGFDDLDRQIYAADIPANEDVGVQETHTEFSEHGPVEELQETIGAQTTHRNRTLWEYDEQGNLVRKAVDPGDDGELNQETRFIRDDQGRILEEIEEFGTRTTHITRSYACSG